MTHQIKLGLCALVVLFSAPLVAEAAEYKIDPAHSFVEFRIPHLGYSWLYGRFDDVSGRFRYDAANPGENAIEVNVDPSSIDTNHAERDKHLRDPRFLDVTKYMSASFRSTKFTGNSEKGVLEGEMTVHGITRPVKIDITRVGQGNDPWGGYRAGFHGTWNMTLEDFGITYNLGPASKVVEMEIGIEGIRQ